MELEFVYILCWIVLLLLSVMRITWTTPIFTMAFVYVSYTMFLDLELFNEVPFLIVSAVIGFVLVTMYLRKLL